MSSQISQPDRIEILRRSFAFGLFSLMLGFNIGLQLLTKVSLLSLQLFAYSLTSKIVVISVGLFFLIEFIFGKWTFRDLGILMFVMLSVVLIYKSGQTKFVVVPLMVFNARHFKIETIVRLSLAIQVAFLLVIVAMWSKGILPNEAIFSGIDSFGFKYHSYVPHMVFFDALAYFWINREKNNRLAIIVFFALNVFVFKKAGNILNPFILTDLVLAYEIAGLFGFSFKKVLLSRYIPFLLIIVIQLGYFGILILYALRSPLAQHIDVLLSNRIRLSSDAVTTFGLHLFSNANVKLFSYDYSQIIGAHYNYVDSGFLKYTLYFGVAFILMLNVVYQKTIKRARMFGDYFAVFAVMLMVLHSVVDEEILWIDVNPMIFIFAFAFLTFKREG